MSKTAIEWAEETWNPISGCTKISPGCKFCYAEEQANWLKGMKVVGYENGFAVTVQETRMNEPLKRKKPTNYFVCSMGDLFHDQVKDQEIDRILSITQQASQHTYMVLTKRAERLPVFFKNRKVPDNVWIGVSVEDRKYGLPRIDYLRQVNAKTRFLSIEPLLENLGEFDLSGIHWVIVGGESGNKTDSIREMNKDWVISIRDKCLKSKIPFTFKQWGGYDKSKGGRILDDKVWDEKPVKVITDLFSLAA